MHLTISICRSRIGIHDRVAEWSTSTFGRPGCHSTNKGGRFVVCSTNRSWAVGGAIASKQREPQTFVRRRRKDHALLFVQIYIHVRSSRVHQWQYGKHRVCLLVVCIVRKKLDMLVHGS